MTHKQLEFDWDSFKRGYQERYGEFREGLVEQITESLTSYIPEDQLEEDEDE